MGSGNRRNPATGRKMREAVNSPQGWEGRGGPRPQRSGGRIVRGGRLAAARARNTRSTQ